MGTKYNHWGLGRGVQGRRARETDKHKETHAQKPILRKTCRRRKKLRTQPKMLAEEDPWSLGEGLRLLVNPEFPTQTVLNRE